MRPVPFNLQDASANAMYSSYYEEQSGHGVAIYHGHPSQAGRGVGSFFKRVGRVVGPLARKIGGSLLKAGIGFAGDVASGRDLKDSAKKRALALGSQAFGDVREAIFGNKKRKKTSNQRPNMKSILN